MQFEEVPKRKRIIDFFPEEKKVPQKKKRGAAKKDDEKKKRHRISTYLTDKQYKRIRTCLRQKPSEWRFGKRLARQINRLLFSIYKRHISNWL